MKQGVRSIIYPVKDIARAKILFRQLLGVEPYMRISSIMLASKLEIRISD